MPHANLGPSPSQGHCPGCALTSRTPQVDTTALPPGGAEREVSSSISDK